MKYGILLLVTLLAGFGCGKKAEERTNKPTPAPTQAEPTPQSTQTSKVRSPSERLKSGEYVITGKVHPDIQRMNKLREDTVVKH